MGGGLFDIMNISASGLTAQRTRMDVIAGNVANADTPAKPGQTPFRRRLVELQTMQEPGDPTGAGVQVAQISSDPSALRQVYDPSNPDANAQGYVSYPNVNPVQEMIDLEDASRAYEANVTALNATKSIASKTLGLLS